MACNHDLHAVTTIWQLSYVASSDVHPATLCFLVELSVMWEVQVEVKCIIHKKTKFSQAVSFYLTDWLTEAKSVSLREIMHTFDSVHLS